MVPIPQETIWQFLIKTHLPYELAHTFLCIYQEEMSTNRLAQETLFRMAKLKAT